MAKKLYADGTTGDFAIYDPSNPSAFTDPLSNLQSVFFHSDLDYVGVAKIIDVTVAHPERLRGGTTTVHTYHVPNLQTDTLNTLAHNLGYQPMGLCFVGNDMLPANSQIQSNGSSFRTVAIEINTTTVSIYETSWVYQNNLPAFNQTYKIVLFTQPIQPSGTKTIEIKPDSFYASRGKLDTSLNYIRRVLTAPMFWFSKGKTADVKNGSFKIVTANGSTIVRSPYNGTFNGVPGIGVEV